MEKSFKTFDIQCNLGFEDRVFLTKDEWNTYRRKIAVRYIKKTHTCNCEICGMPFTDKNPAQHAHKIGFKLGIIYLGLTPDFVNSHINIRSAHREKCNSTTELNLADSMELIKNRGITQLPDYLPDEIHKLWLSLEKRKMESDDR